ncbi:unnamed protein product [Didymodactylos carnosus]|uniref:G-protein coupled receptors family 1 profile domain-containing protein n=1 Tax=Didymodactylos carnosus TaxID=1234261 RepID=A0A814JA72_9BILA|nr:unnamed protein product [Didymodactylos carnosus]CAF3803646.1 unnamed protein product [Didymodactylos carnosus]
MDNLTVTVIEWRHPILAVILLCLCIMTIFGNILVIRAVFHENQLHSSTYYYVVSLAFADLFVGCIVIPFALIFEMTNGYWLFGRFLCDFWHAMDIFASTASILALCVIALDRYIAITNPILYPNSFISRKWNYMIFAIWTCSAILSFPIIAYWGSTTAQTTTSSSSSNKLLSNVSKLHFSDGRCEFPSDPYYIVFSSLVSFYLPLFVMVFVYARIFCEANRQMVALRSGFKYTNGSISSYKSISTIIPKFSFKQTVVEKKNPDKNNNTNNKRKLITSLIQQNDDELYENYNLVENQQQQQQQKSSEILTLRIHHGKYQPQKTIPSSTIAREQHHSHLFSTLISNRFIRTPKNLGKKFSKFSRDQKAAKVLGIVMGVFVACWLPFFAYHILSGVFLIRSSNHELLFKIFTWLGYTNSALNFHVYVLTSREFRQAFIKLLCKQRFQRKQQRQIDIKRLKWNMTSVNPSYSLPSTIVNIHSNQQQQPQPQQQQQLY